VRLVAVIITFFFLLAAPAIAADVGFEEVRIANGTQPPLTAGIWYPTNAMATPHSLGDSTQTVAQGGPVEGRGLPLIVMSHGGGGWYDGHYDTALALAHAGFVVAAVSHVGDTFRAGSCNCGAVPPSFANWWTTCLTNGLRMRG
jgi:predicted dienelactone hydrolase